jgi:hypothetical protein
MVPMMTASVLDFMISAVNALAAAGFSPLRYRETLYTVGWREKRKTAVPGGHVDHY